MYNLSVSTLPLSIIYGLFELVKYVYSCIDICIQYGVNSLLFIYVLLVCIIYLLYVFIYKLYVFITQN